MDRYLITGATGYIGSLMAEYLLQQGNMVTLIIRDAERLKSILRSTCTIIECDIRDRATMENIEGDYEYIIHCAASTKSVYMMTNPVEVAETIVSGTENMLKVAMRCNVRSMVYLSSMEVYGKVSCLAGRKVQEDELGDIDLLNVRSCYPIAKRMAENYCYLYWKEYDIPVKIARLAQTFGRDVRVDDNRIFAQFANSVRRQTDIILHTEGNSVGNYCDIDDAIDGILYLLKNGNNGEAYNIVNEANTMTIREMAELVVEKVANCKINISYDIPEDNRFGYAVETGLRLSGEKMKELGWKAKTSLVEMYQNLLRS